MHETHLPVSDQSPRAMCHHYTTIDELTESERRELLDEHDEDELREEHTDEELVKLGLEA
ncbi:hypothetical protein AUR64_18335 [Haloprofundus marisrubri]|uniref:Uncharacterized protein n=1 Tax=Haloprofundus marisrubri TaxID=1514971 RepID=A0A0W1R5A8_9EURY|nr:hypothetical protein AUR64_18335 [Haloprofundus marisrubri]